jgi:signal transduction histidine kinase/ligand-binding sensor domain-containing protein
MYRLLTTLLLICSAIISRAQEDAFTFNNYTTANGLADDRVNGLLEDSRGFIWLATGEGLSRFDGTNFKNFFARKNDSTALPGNMIIQLNEYRKGFIIMVSSGQLTCLNSFTQKFWRPSSFRNKQVAAINRLSNGTYSINSLDTSFIIDTNLHILDTLVPPFKVRQAVSNVEILDDNVWLVGSPFEYFLYDIKKKTFTPFLRPEQFPASEPMLILKHFDRKNKWIYFSNYYEGIFRFSFEGKVLYNWKRGKGPSEIPNCNISFINAKNDSILWIGNAEGLGLGILNLHTNLFTTVQTDERDPSSLASNMLFSNFTDRSNNEWIGGLKGISKLNRLSATIRTWKKAFSKLNDNSSSNLLSMVKGADGQMYITSFGTGYSYLINPATGNIDLLDRSRLPSTWCMNRFGNNEIVFTGGGPVITFYNTLTKQYRHSDFLKKYFPFSDIVILAFKHSNGDEWYSGNKDGGFVRVDAKDGSIHHYKKDGPRGNFHISYYSNYAEDRNGDLWFGVNKSARLLHWDRRKDYFNEVAFDTVPGITEPGHSGIASLILDDKNTLWIAFDGTGIINYDQAANHGVRYTIQDGLPTNYAYNLRFDGKHRLWIGTLKGLSCLLINENRVVNFTREDGLPSDYFDEQCSYFDSTRGELWFASRNMLLRFDPDALLANTRNKIPVYIDDIMVNGQNYKVDNAATLRLSPSQNNLQFRFIGIDINNGKHIEYSYQLTGADKDWIYNDNITTASYANLPPGNYTFTVRARHRGDIEWSVMQAPLAFIVDTPWHRTTWFRVLMGIALSLLVWFIIRAYYLRKLEKEKSILEKQQAIEKERTRIATDMHDDFGASLSRIKFLSEKLQLQKNSGVSPNQDLGKISAYSDEMAEKMGEIVWALNKRYDSCGDLVSFCRSYASEYLEDKPIKLDFSTGVLNEVKINGEIRRNVFLVMKESLHNMVKHADASEVMIHIHCDKEIHMIIQDNGKGFDMLSIRPFANGLDNMKKRMQEVGGQFSIENSSGTKISIVIPTPILQNTYR